MPPVKIAVTSDLHLPITPAETIDALARDIAAYVPDVVAVAGDVGESLADVRRCLDILRGHLLCPVLVVMGNHDVWQRDASSRRKWEEHLPQIVQDSGCIWLEAKAHTHEDVAIAGTIAWYDYSAADPQIREPARVFRECKGAFNMDAYLIDWPWSDLEFAERVSGPFLTTLDELEAKPGIRATIVVTHVPVLECQMCRRPDNRDWGFSNAYFGNLTLGAKILERKKVTHIVSGHTHVGRAGVVGRPDGRTIDARVLASEYRRPVWDRVELEQCTN